MNEVMWAFGRVSGVVSLVLFTLTVVLGILSRSGRRVAGMPRFSVQLVHRNASLLALAFLALHVGTLLLDEEAQLDLVDLVVPFLGDYEPFWQGLGTVAFDLVLAVAITGLLRARIGPRAFKAVHWLSYAMWPIALLHGIGTGSDASSPAFLVTVVVCVVAVVAAAGWRMSRRFRDAGRHADAARPAAHATAAGRVEAMAAPAAPVTGRRSPAGSATRVASLTAAPVPPRPRTEQP